MLLVNGLVLLLPSLMVFVAVSPAYSFRVAEIHVSNRMAEPIAVTPVALPPSGDGRMSVLVFKSRFPAITSKQRGGFVVGPGETRVILYDRFDVWLSELVVAFEDETLRQYVIEPDAPKRVRLPLKVERITIEDTGELQDVSPVVASAAADAMGNRNNWLFWLLWLISVPMFCLLLWVYRRLPDEKSGRRGSAVAA